MMGDSDMMDSNDLWQLSKSKESIMKIGLTLLASRIDSASDVFIDARLASILSGRR